MEKFTYNSKTAEVPSCLDEVSSEQYRQFLILSVLMNRGTISPGQFRVKWLKLQDTAQAENWDSVRDDLSALHESWDAHATYFHITLQHDELNEVESLLARADSFAFEQDEGEFRACVAELKSQLLVLSEMQEISIQNIL